MKAILYLLFLLPLFAGAQSNIPVYISWMDGTDGATVTVIKGKAVLGVEALAVFPVAEGVCIYIDKRNRALERIIRGSENAILVKVSNNTEVFFYQNNYSLIVNGTTVSKTATYPIIER